MLLAAAVFAVEVLGLLGAPFAADCEGSDILYGMVGLLVQLFEIYSNFFEHSRFLKVTKLVQIAKKLSEMMKNYQRIWKNMEVYRKSSV